MVQDWPSKFAFNSVVYGSSLARPTLVLAVTFTFCNCPDVILPAVLTILWPNSISVPGRNSDRFGCSRLACNDHCKSSLPALMFPVNSDNMGKDEEPLIRISE